MNFIFHDGGRSGSKRPKQKQDCVVRAVAIVLSVDYDKVYESFSEMGRKCSRGTEKDLWQNYLSFCNKLEKISFPPIKGQPRMNLDRFCEEYKQGKFILQMAGHLTTVIDGTVHDDFKPREFGCVYAAWKLI